MDFFKDFETELKIFFVLLALAILVGWFGVLSSLSLTGEEVKNTDQQPVATQPQPTPQPPQMLQESEESTTTFSDKSLGVELQYPKEWVAYDELAWVEDDIIEGCSGKNTIENTLILSKQDLGTCVGVGAFSAWPGNFLLSFSNKEWSAFPSVLSAEQEELIEVGGFPAAKYVFTEDSSAARKQAVRIYVNASGRGYIIEFTQNDLSGNYDAEFDEILSSLQFIES